mmetsp:Transcript_140067/g.390425  ORF Transcript_140067/g.390425 Transcript_140067/m.390425 type:complete len:297 (+) Transcript_140067:520-1410(+)
MRVPPHRVHGRVPPLLSAVGQDSNEGAKDAGPTQGGYVQEQEPLDVPRVPGHEVWIFDAHAQRACKDHATQPTEELTSDDGKEVPAEPHHAEALVHLLAQQLVKHVRADARLRQRVHDHEPISLHRRFGLGHSHGAEQRAHLLHGGRGGSTGAEDATLVGEQDPRPVRQAVGVEKLEGAPDAPVDLRLGVYHRNHLLAVLQRHCEGTLSHVATYADGMVHCILVVGEGTNPEGPVREMALVDATPSTSELGKLLEGLDQRRELLAPPMAHECVHRHAFRGHVAVVGLQLRRLLQAQ